jgi:hypothetical protein
MTLDFAAHLRIVNSAPNDDFVQKRSSAIMEVATWLTGRSSANEILVNAEALASTIGSEGNVLNPIIGAAVGAAIKKASPAFVPDEAPLDVFVCFALALSGVLTRSVGGKPQASKSRPCLAAAIALGIALRPALNQPRLEGLRVALLELARRVAGEAAEAARARDELEELPDSASTAQLKKAALTLAANASLDREEVDLLWWAVNGRSSILGGRIAAAPPAVASVAAGFELARMLRHLPLDAHRDLAVRNLPGSSDIMLREFLMLDRRLASELLGLVPDGAERVRTAPTILPLTCALTIAAVESGERAALAEGLGLPLAQAQSVDVWARRALDEASLVRVLSKLETEKPE